MSPLSRLYGIDFGRICGLMSARLGYQCSICERKKFLRSLYEQLKDKSRICLEKKVTEIRHEGDGVVVRCKDGSEFKGDLVIGADGIHSRTRVEMQRLAEETGPKGLMNRDKSSKPSKRSMCNYQKPSRYLPLNIRASAGHWGFSARNCTKPSFSPHPGTSQVFHVLIQGHIKQPQAN